jgi:hypothetical protein
MLWGDGFEIETVLNCRVAAAGLKITEVPSMERERIFGQTNLRTFADGTRVLRTLAAERRRASRRRAERVQVEEQSRALTPVGGIPVVPPAPQAHTPSSSSNGQVNGQVSGQVSGQADAQAGRPVPQPRVEGPARETRDGVSLRLALEEEAS